MALDFLAGCIGGCAGVAVGYPLDTVKVRLQTQDAKNPVYRGTFHCLRSIVQQESVRGLFKGMSSPMASVAVINAMIFGVYGNVQRRLADPESLATHALAGSVAGLVQSFVCSPMELIKTRIQVQEQLCSHGAQLYKGPLDCIRQIWQKEKVRGIFRGLNITIARDIPAFGLYFASYEALTRRPDPTKPLTTFHMLMAGGWAGVFSWIFTYPIDFIKSRLQVDGLGGPRVYNGIGDCVMQVYRNEGIGGFFRGMPTTLIRSFPVNAVTFCVVTWCLRAFDSPAEASSVTYQDKSSFQESPSSTATFGQDRQVFSRPVHNEWLGEWKSSTPVLMIRGVNPIGSAPIYNYTVQYNGPLMTTDWFSSLANSLTQSNPTHISNDTCNRTASATNTTAAGLLLNSSYGQDLKDNVFCDSPSVTLAGCGSVGQTTGEAICCVTLQAANLDN